MNPNATDTWIESSEDVWEWSSSLRELVTWWANRLWLAAAASLAVLTADVKEATADDVRVALNWEEQVAALLTEQDNFTLPTEIVFSNSAGESFVVAWDQEALFTAWSLQQVFSTLPSEIKPQIEQDWLALPTSDMQTVLSIHAWTTDLDWDTQAHEFYHTMLRAFLELGREDYIQHAPISDPEGWEWYSAEEISEDWEDFMEKFSEGVTNTDLNYRVIGNPDFFNGISVFFPNHPVTAEIQKELSIIMAELDGQVAELDGQVAESIKCYLMISKWNSYKLVYIWPIVI